MSQRRSQRPAMETSPRALQPMTITHLAAGPAEKKKEQPAVKSATPQWFLPPRPAQVKMLFRRAPLVGCFSRAERERVPPCFLPPLGPTPAMLFERDPLPRRVCPKPKETRRDPKGVPSIADSGVCGVEVRPDKKAYSLFQTPPEPRPARMWRRARSAQGVRDQPAVGTAASGSLSAPVQSTRCLDAVRVCGVGCSAGAEMKAMPLWFLAPPEPRPAKLFKPGVLAEGTRSKARTSGGFLRLCVGGFECVSGGLSLTPPCTRPCNVPATLAMGRPIGTRCIEPPSAWAGQDNRESLSLWGRALGPGHSRIGPVHPWSTSPGGELVRFREARLEPPSASFTLKGEKHWGVPARGRRIPSKGMVTA